MGLIQLLAVIVIIHVSRFIVDRCVFFVLSFAVCLLLEEIQFFLVKLIPRNVFNFIRGR